jgi:RNA polymerase sigma factor (sigma-70 family)
MSAPEGFTNRPATQSDTSRETPTDLAARHLRRVVIEEDQRRKVEHARLRSGYGADVDLHAHDQATFELINACKELDQLPGADVVVPMLDDWKFWTKVNDWDSRNALLERLTAKVQRKEATTAELELLIVLCAPTWSAVTKSLRRYGGVPLDPGAEGPRQREEARRVNELDRQELDGVIQNALLDALGTCPRPFPRRFFPWLKQTLAHRALDHIRTEICEYDNPLDHDETIGHVLDQVLSNKIATGSPAFTLWLRTLDLPSLFDAAQEFRSYAGVQTACARAVDRLPSRQRQVVKDHYFKALTQTEIAQQRGVADSTVRNTHMAALGNLRKDDDLFEVLEAVGKVRDRDRRLSLQQSTPRAA